MNRKKEINSSSDTIYLKRSGFLMARDLNLFISGYTTPSHRLPLRCLVRQQNSLTTHSHPNVRNSNVGTLKDAPLIQAWIMREEVVTNPPPHNVFALSTLMPVTTLSKSTSARLMRGRKSKYLPRGTDTASRKNRDFPYLPSVGALCSRQKEIFF